MRSKDLAFILLRVLAIYILIQPIQFLYNYVIGTLQSLSEFGAIRTNKDILSLILGTPLILMLVISAILLIFTDKISNYMIPKRSNVESESKFTLDELQYVVFSFIGVMIIVFTFTDLINLIPQLIKYNEISAGLTKDYFINELIFAGVALGFKLIIGFSLLFGSKGLTALLNKIRSLGVE